MLNPWNEIKLDDYENHMKLASVMQLQSMNEMMYEQFYGYPVTSVMILGIAGGNGLNHVNTDKLKKFTALILIRSIWMNASDVIPNCRVYFFLFSVI